MKIEYLDDFYRLMNKIQRTESLSKTIKQTRYKPITDMQHQQQNTETDKQQLKGKNKQLVRYIT